MEVIMIQLEQLVLPGSELYMALKEFPKNIGNKFKIEKNYRFWVSSCIIKDSE